MTALDITGFRIESIPDEIRILKTFKRLGIVSCNLKELPDALGDLDNLEEIIFKQNQIKKISSSNTKLPNASGNSFRLHDTIPNLLNVFSILISSGIDSILNPVISKAVILYMLNKVVGN
jgi:Leucine-rich repeat (LRR) protein